MPIEIDGVLCVSSKQIISFERFFLVTDYTLYVILYIHRACRVRAVFSTRFKRALKEKYQKKKLFVCGYRTNGNRQDLRVFSIIVCSTGDDMAADDKYLRYVRVSRRLLQRTRMWFVTCKTLPDYG